MRPEECFYLLRPRPSPKAYGYEIRAFDLPFEHSDPGFCNGGRDEGLSRWRHDHAFKLKVEGSNSQFCLLSGQYLDLLSRIQFIKTGAEGYDCTILESLSGLITHVRSYIRAEAYSRLTHSRRRRMYDFLTTHDYELYRTESESNHRGSVPKESWLTACAHFDVFCVPRRPTSLARDGHVSNHAS